MIKDKVFAELRNAKACHENVKSNNSTSVSYRFDPAFSIVNSKNRFAVCLVLKKNNAGPDSYKNKRFHCNYIFICFSCFLGQVSDALNIAATDDM